MSITEGKGVFIYGDEPGKSFSVTWRLTKSSELSNTESWWAEVICERPTHDALHVDIFDAHDQDYVFKLKIDDGHVFTCGVYDLDHILDAYPTLYFEICSREQRMGKFSAVNPTQT